MQQTRMMFKRVDDVRSGFINPKTFNQVEITRRCSSLHLSRHQDIESVHTSAVNTVDMEKSEDRYLLSGCSDGSIYIHDVINLTGRPQYTAKCVGKVIKTNQQDHRCSIECVSWYGNDSALFITSGTDRSLKIWDTNRLKSIEEFYSRGRIYHHDCANVPISNSIIAVASSLNFVELIDLRTGSSVHELRGHRSSILTCSWSPISEHILASGGIDKSIFLWDIRSSSACLKVLNGSNNDGLKETAHSGYVNGLKFTDDGLYLVSVGTDNKIHLWETLSGFHKKQTCAEIKNDVKKNVQFAMSNNSKPTFLYMPSEGNIYIVEMLSGSITNILHGHFHLVNCCFYRSTLQELYSGGNDRNILLWTADEPQEDKTIADTEIKGKVRRKKIAPKIDSWSSDED